MITQAMGERATKDQIRVLITPIPFIGGPPGLVSSGTAPSSLNPKAHPKPQTLNRKP